MRWQDRLSANPYGTSAALAAVVLGTLGAILGDQISPGMAKSLNDSADAIAHIWGAVLAFGGLIKLVGLCRHMSELEIPGLWLMSVGYGFYSITVLAGRGGAAAAASTISAALAIGCLMKVRLIMRASKAAQAAKATKEAARQEGGPGNDDME